MTDDFELEPALLTRYFTGDCTRAEAAAFERWTAARPEREALVAELRKVWCSGAAVGGARIDTERAWSKIAGQLTGFGTSGAPSRPHLKVESGGRASRAPARINRPLSAPARWARRFTAAAALVLTVGGAAWLSLRHTPAVYANENGGRRVVTLADGTRVTLGPASTVRELTDLTGPTREVELDGLAFFQVTHDARRPFRVRARGAEARVLGTEFTVRAYPDERDVEVAVRSGRVAVRSETAGDDIGQTPVLTAGHRAFVAPGGAIRLDQVDAAAVFAWTTGVVRFESTPLGEVTREIGRWIASDIVVSDSNLSGTKVTVAFTDLSRDSVLARLGRLAGTRPLVTSRGIVLRPEHETLHSR